MNPAITAAALASAEKNVATLEAKALSLAGLPNEESAWILVGAAKRITNNLRQVHEVNERRQS